jgi:serine/threonine-protein kinase
VSDDPRSIDQPTGTIQVRREELPTANALPVGAAERRAVAAAGSVPGPQMSQQLSLQTLREEEAQTALAMIALGRWVGVACLFPLAFLGGSFAMQVTFAIGIGFAVVFGYAVEYRIRKKGYDDVAMVALAISVGPAVYTGMLYFGIFSAAQLFPAVAMYFFARRERFGSALALCLINAVAQAVCAALVIFGAIDDPGLFHVSYLSTGVLVACHALLQIGHFGAFLLGRSSHRAGREAIERMQHAMRAVAQREALLLEARQDLDRALRIDSAGRYTDHTFGGYRLGYVIGRGGMGEVYEGFHVDTGDAVAVKLLAHRELGNPRSVERFVREVRAVRSLTSPHVVRVLGASDEGDPIPYLVMERLHGHDLAHHLRSGRMPAASLDILLAQVGAALEEAWQHEIVHRDLKPQNLFLADGTGEPSWKVLDFGIAALGDHAGTLTQGHVVGTPAYMAPEQARGERVDYRADVYALAAIAYRWLTGRPVCATRDLHTALYQTVHVMPQRPSELASELHADVDAALAIGLVKDPNLRWQRASDLRVAIASALDGTLDPALRDRATEILASHPWGAVRG